MNCLKFTPFYFKSHYVYGSWSRERLRPLSKTIRMTHHLSSISWTRGVGVWWPVGVYVGGVCICVLSCGVLFTYGKNGCVIRQCTCRYMMSGFGCKEAVNIIRSNVNVTKFMEIILLFWAVAFYWTSVNFIEIKNDYRLRKLLEIYLHLD